MKNIFSLLFCLLFCSIGAIQFDHLNQTELERISDDEGIRTLILKELKANDLSPLKNLQNLVELTIGNAQYDYEHGIDPENFPYLPSLIKLDLSGAYFLNPNGPSLDRTKRFFSNLGQMIDLKELNLSTHPNAIFDDQSRFKQLFRTNENKYITNSLKALEEIQQVKVLSLAGLMPLDANIEEFPELPNLEFFDCSDNHFSHLFNRKRFPKLKHLKMVSTTLFYDRLAVIGLSELNELRSLDFSRNSLLSVLPLINELSKLPNFTELKLTKMRYLPVGIDRLVNLKNLQKLDMAFCIYDGDVEFFDQFSSQLEELNLSWWSFSDRQKEQLHYVSIPSLKGLDLSFGEIKGVPLQTLASNLKELNVSNSDIRNGDLKNISKITSLEVLNLANTHLKNNVAVHLKNLRTLKTLNLKGLDLRECNFQLLSPLSELQYLNLDASQLTRRSFLTLCHLAQLEELSVRGFQSGSIRLEDKEVLKDALRTTKIIWK